MFLNKERPHKSVKCKKLEELVLPNAKLKFCTDQLQNLNFIFNKRLERNSFSEGSLDRSILLAKSVTERLVQRLLCGAAQIDPRFASKYLINNRFQEKQNISANLEYLVRLDSLSTPLLYSTDDKQKYEILENDHGCPPGYARIRLHSSTLKIWGEFINSSGYLRRDRIQARLVELLAEAAGQEKPSSPLQVDESVSCGIPGKVVDPATLYYILEIPTDEHVYYGPGGNVPRFPDTRDFRLAIVDEPNGIKIRVEFLSPALSNICIKVRILIAIGADSWPSTSNFPARIPLGHSDCLLYHQAAQTGMYLVGYGVHSSAWQIRLAAAEYVLLNHYGPNSTVRTILDILHEALSEINSLRRFQKPVSYKILNKYMFFTVLLEELEEDSKFPFLDMLNWSPMYLSTLVLKLLDKTIPRLHAEFQSNYFFKKANLLVNPGHLCDDDFITEASNVKNYMIRLFDESLMSNSGNDEFSNLLLSQESEMMLLYKWKDLIDGFLPTPGTRGRRFCFVGSRSHKAVVHTQYTTKQLEYIGLVLQSMLKVKQNILQPHQPSATDFLSIIEDEKSHPVEDIIFILVTIMDQARDQYLSNSSDSALLKNRAKIRVGYNVHVSKLVELIRKDKELFLKPTKELQDDLTLVKLVLKWLYKALDQNKKYLAPILRPYLNTIFSTSHSVSCNLDLIKERLKNDEIIGLGSFSHLVNQGGITPAQGLMDSLNKNWLWAKDMLALVKQNTLRLVFIQGRGQVSRHILSLPSYTDGGEKDGCRTWCESKKDRKKVKRRTTMPGRGYFSSIVNEAVKDGNMEIPQHETLKINSPLTVILSKKHRTGQHRGCEDILKNMTSMQKLSVFQEATSFLPKEEQTEILDVIQNIHTAKSKKALNKKWSSTLPHFSSSSKTRPYKDEPIQRYTPKEESAGIKISSPEKLKFKKSLGKTESLLGTTRAARLREDNSVFLLEESFKIKSLVHKSDSLKY